MTPHAAPSHPRFAVAPIAVLLAALIAVSFAPAQAGILWVDTHHESIAIPLESPTLGLARARAYVENGQLQRARMALRKVVARYPGAAQARALLADLERSPNRDANPEPDAAAAQARP